MYQQYFFMFLVESRPMFLSLLGGSTTAWKTRRPKLLIDFSLTLKAAALKGTATLMICMFDQKELY